MQHPYIHLLQWSYPNLHLFTTTLPLTSLIQIQHLIIFKFITQSPILIPHPTSNLHLILIINPISLLHPILSLHPISLLHPILILYVTSNLHPLLIDHPTSLLHPILIVHPTSLPHPILIPHPISTNHPLHPIAIHHHPLHPILIHLYPPPLISIHHPSFPPFIQLHFQCWHLSFLSYLITPLKTSHPLRLFNHNPHHLLLPSFKLNPMDLPSFHPLHLLQLKNLPSFHWVYPPKSLNLPSFHLFHLKILPTHPLSPSIPIPSCQDLVPNHVQRFIDPIQDLAILLPLSSQYPLASPLPSQDPPIPCTPPLYPPFPPIQSIPAPSLYPLGSLTFIHGSSFVAEEHLIDTTHSPPLDKGLASCYL